MLKTWCWWLNGVHSNTLTSTLGIPQGSVLGPLLFLVYINDMSKVIQHSEMHHFADDTNLLYSSNSMKKINRYINHKLKYIVHWLRANRISLKACVPYFLFFHRMKALQKLWKMLFISSKKTLFPKIFKFLYFRPPLFLPVSHCFKRWSKINLKVYSVISCLNKNLIKHFVWNLEKEKRYDIETLSMDRVTLKLCP